MTHTPTDQAVSYIRAKEKEVVCACLPFDKMILDTRRCYLLTEDPASWPSDIAKKLSRDGKTRRASIRLELQNLQSKWKRLTRPIHVPPAAEGQSNGVDVPILDTGVVGSVPSHGERTLSSMITSAKYVDRQYFKLQKLKERVDEVYSTRSPESSLSIRQRVRYRRYVPRSVQDLEELRACRDSITQSLSQWSEYFSILTSNECLEMFTEALRLHGKTARGTFLQRASPVAGQLARLYSKRQSIIHHAAEVYYNQEAFWTLGELLEVPHTELHDTLQKFDRLIIDVQVTLETERIEVQRSLDNLAKEAWEAPPAVPYGDTMIEANLKIFNEAYEALWDTRSTIRRALMIGCKLEKTIHQQLRSLTTRAITE